MNCKFKTNEKHLKAMLVIGVALLIIGIAAGLIIDGRGTENPLGMRLAGFCSGIGGAFAAMGGVFLLRRRLLGEKMAMDDELQMTDERGQLIAYKTQGVLALTAVAVICAQLIIAMVRGDSFYMLLGTAGCFVAAIASGVARVIFSRRL